MAITIPSVTDLPTPPQKSDSDNFPSRADAFVEALDTFADELNDSITELNKLGGGLDQQEPIAAYSASTTYDFPDVVAYTDGNTYRCIDNSVVGITPGTDTASWVNISANGDELNESIDELTALVGNGALGVNQTRQDVLSSRSAGVTYTNSTDKPIFVSIIMQAVSLVAGTLYVNGEDFDTGKLRSTSSLTIAYTLQAVVLPGETYFLSGTTPISWKEIR